jgi:translation initiation factor 6
VALRINLFDIYRSANIGIFLRANDDFCLVPKGLAPTKSEKIARFLQSQPVFCSISGSRLLGPLSAMNGKGIVLSRLAEDDELDTLRKATGLKVERLDSRFTSVGNLISANDYGAVVSDVFGNDSVRAIESTLGVSVRKIRLGLFVQVGAMISATNAGALVHPAVSDRELKVIEETLRVEPEPATVNGGVPFVSSGFVGNSKGVLVGSQTRGNELVIIGRAFAP